MYTEWIGRFTATFIQISFVKFHLVAENYFVHTLALFTLTFMACFFVMTRINKYILRNVYPKVVLVHASLIFLLLNLYVYEDITSGFYWFSGAITYQVPAILFLVFSGLLLQRFNITQHKNMIVPDIINSILIILLAGCNETFAISVSIILLYATLACFYFKLAFKKVLGIYLLVSVSTGLVIMLSSGILDRQKIMAGGTSYLAVFPIILFRIISIFYTIFQVSQ